ncbi:MAG TPA: ACT domain-containing protein, partial [Nitrospirae bacterium]|nr:ACT domain-containing protein [Nitrospirota bacterium]
NLVNRETIETMKDGVYIINCARGGIVNEKDLGDAIQSGKVGGAALDVFEKEPPEDLSLIKLDRVICTPHLAASTREAQENVAIAIAEQVVDYLLNGTIRNAVNFPSIPADQLPRLRPYITLAEALGSFAAQVYEGGITEVTVEFRGEAGEIDTKPVTIAALKGLLTPILTETVNFVNAPLIARERGIEVKEMRSPDSGNFHNMLVIKVKANGKENAVYGTLYGKKEPRIIRVDSFPVEIIPEGIMLYIHNKDRPGVIGNIGALLGKNNINIARMHFGRESAAGMAISVVSVDAEVSAGLLDEIRELPNIISVRLIRL